MEEDQAAATSHAAAILALQMSQQPSITTAAGGAMGGLGGLPPQFPHYMQMAAAQQQHHHQQQQQLLTSMGAAHLAGGTPASLFMPQHQLHPHLAQLPPFAVAAGMPGGAPDASAAAAAATLTMAGGLHPSMVPHFLPTHHQQQQLSAADGLPDFSAAGSQPLPGQPLPGFAPMASAPGSAATAARSSGQAGGTPAGSASAAVSAVPSAGAGGAPELTMPISHAARVYYGVQPPKRSPVWQIMVLATKNLPPEFSDSAIACLLCGHWFNKQSSTTNLARHIRNNHNDHVGLLQNPASSTGADGSAAPSPAPADSTASAATANRKRKASGTGSGPRSADTRSRPTGANAAPGGSTTGSALQSAAAAAAAAAAASRHLDPGATLGRGETAAAATDGWASSAPAAAAQGGSPAKAASTLAGGSSTTTGLPAAADAAADENAGAPLPSRVHSFVRDLAEEAEASEYIQREEYENYPLIYHGLDNPKRSFSNVAAEAIVRDLLPIDLFDHPGMRSVSTTLNPDRKPASEEQMRSLIPQLRLELASLTKKVLAQNMHVLGLGWLPSVSRECWVASDRRPFSAIHCHFVDSSWKMAALHLAIVPDLDTDSPDAVVEYAAKVAGLKVPVGGNLFFALVEPEGLAQSAFSPPTTLSQVPSIADVINRGAQAVLALPPLVNPLLKIRNALLGIVSSKRTCLRFYETLPEHLVDRKIHSHDNPQFWRTLYYEIDDFLVIVPFLRVIATEANVCRAVRELPTEAECDLLRDAATVLGEVERAVSALEKSSADCFLWRHHASTMLCVLARLQAAIAAMSGRGVSAVFDQIRETLLLHIGLKSLQQARPELWMTTLFDVRCKTMLNQQSALGMACHSRLQDEAVETSMQLVHALDIQAQARIAAEAADDADEAGDDHPAKRMALDSSAIPDSGSSGFPLDPADIDVNKEIVEYLSIPAKCEDTYEGLMAVDPLAWWREHAARFPVLALMARKYLSIPGSHAPISRACPATPTVSLYSAWYPTMLLDDVTFCHLALPAFSQPLEEEAEQEDGEDEEEPADTPRPRGGRRGGGRRANASNGHRDDDEDDGEGGSELVSPATNRRAGKGRRSRRNGGAAASTADGDGAQSDGTDSM